MTLVPTRLLAAAAASALLIGGTASSAHAATWSHVDLSRDVMGGPMDAAAPSPTPAVANADVTRVRVTHGQSAVVVRVKTRAAVPKANWLVVLKVKTPTRVYDVQSGRLFGTSTESLSRRPEHTDIECTTTTTVDRPHRLVVLRIPRTCLKDPRWVRVGAGVATFARGKAFVDDGLVRGAGGQNQDLVVSPRVRVG